jgi:hypothetical protein
MPNNTVMACANRRTHSTFVLGKGYDYARVDAEVAAQAYLPHIRRIGEKKQRLVRRHNPLGAGSLSARSPGLKAYGRFVPATRVWVRIS